ncbi:hypothetical protein LPJ73_000079 [Coemansia sp. RSA 2703]|nr:hypothetical protein LPJ73_000079 [Coemansia sp. RSA 2703]KAJ2379596.1 hypothetical protein IW150_000046 [Coemansia sp. RSA 2607]
MSSLHARLAIWNGEAANPTRTKVTATAVYRDGVACGHSDGKIWLYEFNTLLSPPESEGDAGFSKELGIYPKCTLAAHQSSISLLKLAEVNSPLADGTEGALLSISSDGDVVLWAVSDGRCLSRIRTPLQNIRPTVANIQTVDYQPATEDLLFISGEGRTSYVLSFPSLEVVHEWQLPHSEWVTAQVVRRRKDHFRSELITCTNDGVVRMWSYDELAISQQDVFSRAASPRASTFADIAVLGTGTPASGSESVSSDQDSELAGTGRNGVFCLESTFAALGEEYAIIRLVVNPFNDDEFLAVSPTIVRLFASRDSELHELLRWKAQRTNSAAFAGAGFLTKSDIVFWDALGNIFNVCSSFAVEGGSVGMHLTRGQHAERTGEQPEFSVSSFDSVFAGSDSALGMIANQPNTPINVLTTYTSNRKTQSLSVVLPVPLSSVCGSANRPHVDPEDSKSKVKNWLGGSTFFEMNELWSRWLEGIKLDSNITSTAIMRSGRIALGFSDGMIRLASPMTLMCKPETKARTTKDLNLSAHRSAITALFEWDAMAIGACTDCRDSPNDDQDSHIGSILISASKDLTIKIWDTTTGECLYTLPCQSAPIVAMLAVLPATKTVAWNQESERHRKCAVLLESLVLAVSSDNSTTLISMDSLERIHVTAPYHEHPVRLSLCKDSADLLLRYSDDTQTTIELSHLVDISPTNDVTRLDQFPSYTMSMLTSTLRLVGDSAAANSDHSWASIHFLLAQSNFSKLRANNGVPSAVVLDIEIIQLYSAVSKLVSERTGRQELQRLILDEATSRSSSSVASNNNNNSNKGVLWPLNTALMLMSVLCTWGISKDLDATKQNDFGLAKPLPNVAVSLSNKYPDVHTVVFPSAQVKGFCWCVSPLLNAQRMMAILVLSQSILQGNEKKAVEVINYYVGRLPNEVGARFRPPCLLTLAKYWQSPNVARCASGAVNAEDLYALTIVCIIGSDFPSLLLPTARSMAASILQALITNDRVGTRSRMVAIELLSRGFSAFKSHIDNQLVIRRLLAIMMSVSEDGHGMGIATQQHQQPQQGTIAAAAHHLSVVPSGSVGPRRAMSGVSIPAAIRGAGSHGESTPGSRRPSHARRDPDSDVSKDSPQVQSSAEDGIEDIARKSAVAGHLHRHHKRRVTHSSRSPRPRNMSVGDDSSSVGNTVSFNLVVLAKSALLRISTSEISLIASTANSILRHGENLGERRGALQLIGLVAQKYPVLLYPYLEGLATTIVQAIEPKHATARKQLISAAGAALQGLVRTYPWVSFHPESQCLAVGCIDGRCTTFDLRTATRTAVYDSQAAGPVVAVAISPRGDRVASFTLGNGMLSIWDPSPSALAMFARSLFWSATDNGEASEASSGTVGASKTMTIPAEFLGQTDDLAMAKMMELAKLTWTADQTVLLQIHDASFSLSLT